MTMKKLTVAAVIAVGMATISLSTAMAACPCGQKAPHKKCSSCAGANIGCENNNLSKSDMKQVYNYPQAVYGENNYVGETENSIYSTYSAWDIDNKSLDNGVAVSDEQHMTGAAASPCGGGCGDLPVINPKINMLDIDKDCLNNAEPRTIDIETENSIDAIKKSFVPYQSSNMIGAAAPLSNVFPDVSDNFWASCDINRLATTGVVVGYPNRTFKPYSSIARAEFASMIVKGLRCDMENLQRKALFKDVPASHWASPVIAKAVEDGLMCGCGNNKFLPQKHVSRVEAMTALSKGLKCDMDAQRAREILDKYTDGNRIPSWAEIPVAKALDAGVLKNAPDSTTINPNKNASRAEIASMLQNVRIAANYDNVPVAEQCTTPCDKKAYVETDTIVKVPTLKLEFLDEINAKSSHVGQQFATTTLEDVTINGKLYPKGSRVNGKIVEVIRPSGCNQGGLKLSFTTIQGCDGCKAELPKQVLTAQVSCKKTPNPVARLVSMPFTLAGSLIGIVGRTTGGMISNAGNAAESLTNGTGIAFGETMQGQFRAAGRSVQDALKTTVKAPIDFTRTAVTGAFNLLQDAGDEVAYLVDPNGKKITSVNPREHVTIGFGCNK